jgi:hypothetical protein
MKFGSWGHNYVEVYHQLNISSENVVLPLSTEERNYGVFAGQTSLSLTKVITNSINIHVFNKVTMKIYYIITNQ